MSDRSENSNSVPTQTIRFESWQELRIRELEAELTKLREAASAVVEQHFKNCRMLRCEPQPEYIALRTALTRTTRGEGAA